MDTSKETFKAFQQDDVLSAADVASNVVIKPEEEYAYGFIIEVLTSGLYLYWLLGTSVPKLDNLVYHHPPIFFVM